MSATARQIERIFGKINSILAKCTFLVIEEASGDIEKYMQDFKNLIAEPTLISLLIISHKKEQGLHEY